MMSEALASLTLGRRPEGRTLVTASWVVGHKDGSHRLLQNGEVVFENGEILFVGHRFPGEVARRIDFGNALISPGLIDLDALSDLDTTILGIDNHPGWAKGRVWPRPMSRPVLMKCTARKNWPSRSALRSASFS